MRWLALMVLLVGFIAFACRSTPREQPPARESGPPADRGLAAALVQRGETLYQASCQSCHGGATGGSMMDIPPRHNQVGHTWHHPDCQLTRFILDGTGNLAEMQPMMRGMMRVPADTPQMPKWRGILSEDEVSAILSYIKTWWTPGQRAAQAEVTRLQCS